MAATANNPNSVSPSIPAPRSRKLSDDRYPANNRPVEGRKLLCRNPIFQMSHPAGLSHAVAFEKTAQHLEARDESGAAGGHVPVPGDFHGIFLRQHRVKDRLLGK